MAPAISEDILETSVLMHSPEARNKHLYIDPTDGERDILSSGHGVFANKAFEKGTFLLEYKGDLVSQEEGARRERKESQGNFMFFFSYGGKRLCMDASLDPFDVNTARMVNDSPNTEANATMKIVPFWNQPRLCLFALRDIAKGDEIRYDYGVPGLPWRKGPEKKKFKRELAVPNPRLSDLTFCGLYEKSFSLNKDKSALKETCAATAIEKDETTASFGKVQAVTKGAVGEPEDSSDSTQYPLFSACSTSVKIGKGTTDQKADTDKSALKETCAATAIEKDETSASFGKVQAVTKGAVGEPEDSSDSTQYLLFSACSTSVKIGKGTTDQKADTDEAVKGNIPNYKKPLRPCPFCSIPQTQLPRHIKRAHKGERDVQKALELPTEGRIQAFDSLRKLGMLKANMIILGNEENPKYHCERQKMQDLVKCTSCSGFYARKFYSRHKSKCSSKMQKTMTSPPTAVPVRLLSKIKHCDNNFIERVLSRFEDDAVGTICKTDDTLIEIGRRLWDKERGKSDKKPEVRKSVMANMRSLGHLYAEFKRQAALISDSSPTVRNIGEIFRKEHFRCLEAAILEYTKASSDSNTEVKAGLKRNLYYRILKAAEIVHATYLLDDKQVDAQEVQNFISIFKMFKNYIFGDAEYLTMKNRQTNLRKPSELPLDDDVKRLRDYNLEQMKSLLQNYSAERNFVELRDLVVCRLTLFNGRRGGEPCRLTLHEWKEAEEGAWIDPKSVEIISDPLEKRLLEETKIAYMSGKGSNRLVSVLIPMDTVPAISLLASSNTRKLAGVSSSNSYLFAMTKQSDTHVSGWSAVNSICISAQVSMETLLNATKNRHRISTLYHLAEVPEDERRYFYSHMGHSEQINKDVYQCPLAVMAVTKVGKRLHQLDNSLAVDIVEEPENKTSSKGVDFRNLAKGELDYSVNQDSDCEYVPDSEDDTTDEEEDEHVREPLCTGTSTDSSKRNSRRSALRRYFRWNSETQEIVRTQFREYILDIKTNLPGKKEIVDFIESDARLSNIPWDIIKTKVMNDKYIHRRKVIQRKKKLGC